jgi:2',3'-cyclic-nucleotide 2'-phosphodiesterase (5'-nucleotidase family)
VTAPRLRAALARAALAGLALAAGAREVPITILHTADLHGRIVNTLPERTTDRPEAGLLRAATHIRRVRAETPNVLLADLGDTFQGSPESHYSRGRVVADALRHLRYDAVVLGNHEFDYGADRLRAWTELLHVPLLAANWRPRLGALPPRAAPWTLHEIDGVRVAFVGLTTSGIPHWSLPEVLGDWGVERSIPALERIMPAVRAARPDVKVLLAHQGMRGRGDEANELARVAQAFPDFDVVLGGHTHEEIAGRRVGETFYAQAGWHGHVVGRVDLVADTITRRVTRISGSLLTVDDTVPPDPELHERVRPALDEAERRLARVWAHAPEARPSYAGPGADHDVAALLRRILRETTGAEAAFHGALSTAGLEAGPVTERDLWRLIPYENRIGTLELTARELAAVLEDALAAGGGRFTWGISGLRVEIDSAARVGSRVVSILDSEGRPLHARRRIRIAFNSYDLASAGGRLPALRGLVRQPECRYQLSERYTREAAADWMKKHWPPPRPARP